jgi:hypothetical protein
MMHEVSGEQTLVNGRNGTALTSAQADVGLVRRTLINLAIFGSMDDARLVYFQLPGSSQDGWSYLERVLLPLRAYVTEGEPPYVQPLRLEIWEGVQTPQGDCAEDALPLEARNPERALAEAQWFEQRR